MKSLATALLLLSPDARFGNPLSSGLFIVHFMIESPFEIFKREAPLTSSIMPSRNVDCKFSKDQTEASLLAEVSLDGQSRRCLAATCKPLAFHVAKHCATRQKFVTNSQEDNENGHGLSLCAGMRVEGEQKWTTLILPRLMQRLAVLMTFHLAPNFSKAVSDF